MRPLVIASANPGKSREIAELLSGRGFELRSLRDYPPMPEPEETGASFAENASIKAFAAANHTGELAIADDSGLVIDALDGAPGIYSSRFAGEGATDEERCAKVLELMKDVADGRRRARFVCVAAVAVPGRIIGTAEGVCEGRIAREPRGSHGFGYDPIFYVEEFEKTMAELPAEVKNRISHRGRTFEAVKALLERLAQPGLT